MGFSIMFGINVLAWEKAHTTAEVSGNSSDIKSQRDLGQKCEYVLSVLILRPFSLPRVH